MQYIGMLKQIINIRKIIIKALRHHTSYIIPVSQKLPVKGFKWVKKLSEFNSIEFDEHFIKNQDENSDKGYFLEVDVEYPKKLFNRLIRIFHFYLKERKAKNVTSLFATYKTRKSMLFT